MGQFRFPFGGGLPPNAPTPSSASSTPSASNTPGSGARAPTASSTRAQQAAPAAPVVLTVSELQRRLRNEIEQRYTSVLVAGEISNYQLHARSGHAYFTLKDAGAQVKCVMFRDQLLRVRHRITDGLEVVLRGRVTVYEQGGQLQINVQSIDPRGLGARQLEIEERIEKLRREGLTADARKRPIPKFPRAIGVVTSPSGAALRDVLRTILRRDPFAHVILSPTPVQGDGAAQAIVRAIQSLDALRRVDVILVCRGGGSTEDLWCFNEEIVARAIVAARVPVITGVGHETDTTVADLVSDLRASTPTAAAEHAVPVRSELRQALDRTSLRLHRALAHAIEARGRRLSRLEARLRDPRATLERRAQRLDDLTVRAERALRAAIARRHRALDGAERRLQKLDPAARLGAVAHALARIEARMHGAIVRRVERERHRLARGAGDLEALSPLKVLSRGYALTFAASGDLVRSAKSVAVGDPLRIRLAEGALAVRVESTADDDDGA